MISAANVSVKQATHYYKADDYYTTGMPPTHWVGKLAESLGLSGSPSSEDFAKLLAGEMPTGETLHRGGGSRRAATDLTFSAPKSVSIAGLVAGDDRVITAHEAAVRKVLDEVEKLVGARVTENKETRVITTGQAIFATVRHDTSRAGDPQLHTHSLLFNVTRLDDGRYRAIENKEIFKQRRQLDQLYKAELAKALVELGYPIRLTREGFELAHISREQISAFSSRAKAIEEALKERGVSREEASAQLRQVVTRATRERKQHFDRETLLRNWKDLAQDVGIDLEHRGGNVLRPREEELPAYSALTWAVAHLGEREQAWSRSELVDAALNRCLGFAGIAELHEALDEFVRRGSLIEKQDGTLTTPLALEKEIRVLELESAGRGAVPPLFASDELPAMEGYTEGQRAAITLATTTSNRVIGVQGYAGTGKTTMLKGVVELAKQKGFDVTGVASVRSAITAMTGSGIQCASLVKWLHGPGNSLNERSIVVLDEASLTSLSQFSALLEKVEAAGARLIAIGDVAQYESVESGKVFHQLQQAGMHTAVMDEIQRQKANPVLLQAAELAAQGCVRESLEKLDVRSFASKTDRHQAIAHEYARGQWQSTLVLTGTNSDRKSLNAAIRNRLSLDKERQLTISIFDKADLTDAEKKHADSFQIGAAVRFERRYPGLRIEKGDIAKVSGFKGNRVILEKSDGGTVLVDPVRLSSKGISIGDLVERQIANNDLIRFTASGVGENQVEFCNGDRAIVSLNPEREEGPLQRLSVVLERTGQVVELDISKVGLALDYGYAQTGHSAQGLGRERLLLDRDPATRTTHQRSFYTDLTRATHEAVVFTSDAEKLANAIAREASKSTALEADLFSPQPNTFASVSLAAEDGAEVEASVPAHHVDYDLELGG